MVARPASQMLGQGPSRPPQQGPIMHSRNATGGGLKPYVVRLRPGAPTTAMLGAPGKTGEENGLHGYMSSNPSCLSL